MPGKQKLYFTAVEVHALVIVKDRYVLRTKVLKP